MRDKDLKGGSVDPLWVRPVTLTACMVATMKMEMVDHNFVVDHRSELVVATSGRAIPALFGSYLIFVSDRLPGVDGLGVPGVPRHHVHVPGHHDRPHQVVGRHLKGRETGVLQATPFI